jgi:hypothetical protein
MKLYFNQIQPNISWKASSNNNVTIIPKNVKNETPNNTNIQTPWPEDCPVKKYKFNPNPIKHYRKQYTNIDSNKNTFSNLSFIGSMDKPGNNIVSENLTQNSANNKSYCDEPKNNINLSSLTYIQNNTDCNTLTGDKFYDASLNKTICSSLHPSALVIKTANTKLSSYYSSSYRELLYKHNKTFNQNLPLNTIVNDGIGMNCNNYNGCAITFNPSNTKYQTQGPITSSARIANLKYNCGDCSNTKSNNSKCPPNMSLKECDELTKVLQSPICYGCNDKSNIRRKRINILK